VLAPDELLKAAIEISGSAAAIPMRYFRSSLAVEDKADESPVTIADRETETHIREAIRARFPSHGVLGEEFGGGDDQGDYLWVVDPIDGTRSFICGVPLFGMLLGVMHKGKMQAGVIRMPALGECYSGASDMRATLNGAPIRCSNARGTNDARIFINEANLMVAREPERLNRLLSFGRVRRFFNDCYPFALLAAGHIDAVVDFDLKPYDFLPFVPVVEGAGGIVTDWSGAPLNLASDGSIVAAATPELHGAIVDLLA
jgi:histidinol phosphatase-like enzyme (inositol monophosphatase family)